MKLAAAFFLVATPALSGAQDAALFDLGRLLAADEACGLSFNEAAVDAYLIKYADPTDLSASRLLDVAIRGTRSQLRNMKPTDLAVQCKLARRSADALGLLQK